MDEAVTGSEQEGYRAPQVCHLIGITYRQLDYWARTDLLKPSLRAASGSGTQRLYSFTDLVQLKVIKRLLDTGINLPKIRKAIEWLRSDMAIDHPLRDATLLSDGNDIWTSDNSDQTHHYLMDILKKGQGVFAIAVGQVQRDLEGESLKFFPTRVPSNGQSPANEATAP
ncbi:MAG: MerR family transcriptional regulator [bacterium]|nr:MerR family transcriptional regulator [bacterium]